VVENVRHGAQNTSIPVNERQIRPLARLPLDQQLIAWQRAIDTGREDMITAAEIVCEAGMALMKIRDKKYYHDVLGGQSFYECYKERGDFGKLCGKAYSVG